jgi:hypothetical protein
VLSDRPADALDPNRRPQQGARYGLPGGSALAEYQQRRKDELAAQLPSLPLRLAGVATAGLAAGFLAARLVIPLAVAPVVVVVAGWLLRPKLSDGTVACGAAPAGSGPPPGAYAVCSEPAGRCSMTSPSKARGPTWIIC